MRGSFLDLFEGHVVSRKKIFEHLFGFSFRHFGWTRALSAKDSETSGLYVCKMALAFHPEIPSPPRSAAHPTLDPFLRLESSERHRSGIRVLVGVKHLLLRMFSMRVSGL